MNILEIDGRAWRTPLTHLPHNHQVCSARLTHRNQRGTFHFEGTQGYEFYRTKHWMPVRSLQQKNGRRWETWMVDDPLHWYAMKEAVEALPSGRILVAGLGLGLMLHHMAQIDRFTNIRVIEYNPDVIDLIRTTIPPDPRVMIMHADFWRVLEHASPEKVDGVLWDLAVGEPHETYVSMMKADALCQLFLPGVPLVVFGRRRHGPRPAILAALGV